MPLTTITPVIIPKKQVAARCGMWNRPVTWNHREGNFWMNIPFFRATNNVEVEWANFRSNPSFTGTGNNEELIDATTGVRRRAALEVVGVGIYPLYAADGSRDLYLAPGEIGKLYLNNQAIPTGTHVLRWKTVYDEIPSRWGTFSSNQSSLTCKNEFGSNLQDRTLDVSWSSSYPEGYAADPPQAITGDSASKKTIEIWGDSIGTEGQSDGGYVPDLGFVQRSCVALSVPFLNNGAGGKAAWQYTSEGAGFLASRNRRRALVPSGSISHAFLTMGTNDLAWGLNSSTMIANLQILKAQAEARGSKLIVFTLPPRTNSANNAKPSADGVNVWQYRNEYNDYVRANNGVGSGYFDLALALEEGSTNLWKSGFSSDGIHPTQSGHAAAKTALDAALPLLLQSWG